MQNITFPVFQKNSFRIIICIFVFQLMTVSICEIEPSVLTGNHQMSVYQCLKNKSYNITTLRVRSTKLELNRNDTQDVINALNGGLLVNLVVLPCRGNQFQVQAEKIYKYYLSMQTYVKGLWISPSSGFGDKCDWAATYNTSNCEFAINLGRQLKSRGIKPGIALLKDGWEYFFENSCQGIQDIYELIWIQFDNIPDFTNYETQKLGNWSHPIAKLYANDVSICGAHFGLLYEP